MTKEQLFEEAADLMDELSGLKCVNCGSYLEFVGDYIVAVACPNHECLMHQIEFDA